MSTGLTFANIVRLGNVLLCEGVVAIEPAEIRRRAVLWTRNCDVHDGLKCSSGFTVDIQIFSPVWDIWQVADTVWSYCVDKGLTPFLDEALVPGFWFSSGDPTDDRLIQLSWRERSFNGRWWDFIAVIHFISFEEATLEVEQWPKY